MIATAAEAVAANHRVDWRLASVASASVRYANSNEPFSIEATSLVSHASMLAYSIGLSSSRFQNATSCPIRPPSWAARSRHSQLPAPLCRNGTQSRRQYLGSSKSESIDHSPEPPPYADRIIMFA